MALRKFVMTLALWTLAPMALMLASEITQGDTVEIINHAQAQEMIDVCGLETVVCEGEKTKVELAIEQIPHEHQETENRITYLYEQAPLYNIDPDMVAHSIYCESMFYNTQSGYVYPDGVREDSWGLAQINLPSHPHITREQALDPYFSIDWKLENWGEVVWYGYDRDTDTCTNNVPEYWN